MRVVLVLTLAAVGLAWAPSSAVACHPVPDPPPPGYYDHGCGDSSKGVKAAATTFVQVNDDFFTPTTVRIQPGDSVGWRWTGVDQHDVRGDPNQTESFRSAFMSGAGKAFSHTFSKPGRFTYICEVHPLTMHAAVEVGPGPPFPDTRLPRLSGLRPRVSGRSVKLSFRLSEASRVRVSLSGPSRKTTSKRLGKGKRSITVQALRAGRYRATLRPTDAAGNGGRAVKSRLFSVR